MVKCRKYVLGGVVLLSQNKLKKLNKFAFFKKVGFWYILASVGAFFVAGLLIYFDNNNDCNVILKTIKDIFVIVATTFGVSLLIGTLIEKKTKNDLYMEIVRDTIESKEFNARLTSEEKQILCDKFTKLNKCQNIKVIFDMYKSIENKFCNIDIKKEPFYLNRCTYDISCDMKSGYIEKTYVKSLYLRSYNNRETIECLRLGSFRSVKYGDLSSHEKKSLYIDGKKISIDKVVIQPDKQEYSGLEHQHGYNEALCAMYCDNINLYSDKDTCIAYQYISRTSIKDFTTIVRCAYPCKSFVAKFHINGDKNKITCSAFGFIDDGKKSPNNDHENDISVEFNEWIFPEDGIVFTIVKK